MAVGSRKSVKAGCRVVLNELAELEVDVNELPKRDDCQESRVSKVISDDMSSLCSRLLSDTDAAVTELKSTASDLSSGLDQSCQLVLEGLVGLREVIAVIEESDRVGKIAKAKGIESTAFEAISNGMAARCFTLLPAFDCVVKRLRVALAAVVINQCVAGFQSQLAQLLATAEMACAYGQHGSLRDVANVVGSDVARSLKLERIREEIANARLIGLAEQVIHVESISNYASRKWRAAVHSHRQDGCRVETSEGGAAWVLPRGEGVVRGA